jgi:23S rRNA (uracil1939-C5)-methyltransferase
LSVGPPSPKHGDAVTIAESLDGDGRGVAHVGGKVIFIEGALPGERVEYAAQKRKASYELATLTRILRESSARIAPPCPHFGTCGGCAMQHVHLSTQVAAKQRVLEDALWHIGKVRAETLLPPIYGMPWGYRHRARLSVRFVPKKGGVLVGFHERKSSYVADIRTCGVLPPHVSALLMPLRELVGALSLRERLPQIEVAVGDEATALVFRVLRPLSPSDEALLKRFADDHGVQVWLQPAGPDSAQLFHPREGVALYYGLPEFGVRIGFSPTDFTQVNHAVNELLVRRALHLLAPRAGERILDLFCGIGNFTLPIARAGATVTGVEGNAVLVAKAAENARANGLAVEFLVADLFDMRACEGLPACDGMLIDPPREGAMEVVKALKHPSPRRLVYVSCDPGTLARDAGLLTQKHGFRLAVAGIANMFPHTAHVESIALFERS